MNETNPLWEAMAGRPREQIERYILINKLLTLRRHAASLFEIQTLQEAASALGWGSYEYQRGLDLRICYDKKTDIGIDSCNSITG
jgi:hypothetical protein